jgi:hypothetical protein
MYPPGTKVRFMREVDDVFRGTIGTVRGEANGTLLIDLPPGVTSWGEKYVAVSWDPDTIAYDITPVDKNVRSAAAVEAAVSAFWDVLEDLYPEAKSIVGEGVGIPTSFQAELQDWLERISS